MDRFIATKRFRSEEDTAAFARWLAPQLRGGDILLLSGDIGSGKSFFCRALILERLATPEDIPSPTFTLVQTYPNPDNCEIWHLDLYRLMHSDELLELGLEEAFTDAICLVEWPDRFDAGWPDTALSLGLSTTETPGERDLTLSAKSSRWAPILEAAHAA